MLNFLTYPRGVFLSIAAAVNTIFWSIVTVLLVAFGMPRRRVAALLRRTWARFILWLSNVEVEVRGSEHLMKDKMGCILLFNHTSHIDILALYGFMRRPICFGAKIELFKIPFFGGAMSAMGALPIDRRHRDKVLQLYEAAIPRLAEGDVFALAPEGTRQPEPKLGRFKFGPFLFGVQAQVKLLPVVIAGAYDVLPKQSLWINVGAWKRKIIIEILEPLSTLGLKETDLDDLQAKVHDQMSRVLERLKLELRSDQTTLVKNL